MLVNSASTANLTITNYEKMTREGLFRDRVAPRVMPSGKSIQVPLADSSERDLQSEIYFPLPPTPAHERKFRRISEGPGEISVHHGLKEQKLPGPEFRYGVRGTKGTTAEQAMKAGQLLGVAEYKNSVAERVYESSRREPLGKPQTRGHTLKMLPQGYGLPSAIPEDGKDVIYARFLPPETEEARAMYKKTHNNFAPGERFSRNYVWPDEVDGDLVELTFKALLFQDVNHEDFKADLRRNLEAMGTSRETLKMVQIRLLEGSVIAEIRGDPAHLAEIRAKPLHGLKVFGCTAQVTRGAQPLKAKDFKFGAGLAAAVEGAGARLALNYDLDEDGNYKRTRLVTKVCEDYRHVQHPKMGQKGHPKQGADGPPIDKEHRFGVKSSVSEYTAQSCIKGYYPLEDQLPDQDLGRCTKPGRRNVTSETRAFGVPSIRTDIEAPHPSKRSIADDSSYGDEPSAASILCPQRFDGMGVGDREFLVRRPREELKALVCSFPGAGDFDELWYESLGLFDDGLPLVSLDAILFVQSGKIERQVGQDLQGLHLTVAV